MANISVSLPADGETADASDYNTPINTIVTEFNGNIDNSNIKANAAISGSKLADASVTPEKLLAGTGTDWVWQNWTPTWTNVSGGTLNYAKYIQIGKTVIFRISYTLAGAGVSGEVSFTPPVTLNSAYETNHILAGSAWFNDQAIAGYSGLVVAGTSTSSIRLRVNNTSGTYATMAALSSTIPFTWGNTDSIRATAVYEAA